MQMSGKIWDGLWEYREKEMDESRMVLKWVPHGQEEYLYSEIY